MESSVYGKNIHPISPGEISHTINDDADNMLSDDKAALLITEGAPTGTIKVTYLNGAVGTLTDYDNYPAVYVKKVWATGTTVDTSAIKLFE
jgi:hypothetical protein